MYKLLAKNYCIVIKLLSSSIFVLFFVMVNSGSIWALEISDFTVENLRRSAEKVILSSDMEEMLSLQVKDAQLNQRLESIVSKLIAAMPRTSANIAQKIPVIIFESNSLEAWHLGREAIFIASAWMTGPDDQVAFVLAHEYGHSVLNHYSSNWKHWISMAAVPLFTNFYLGYYSQFFSLPLSQKITELFTILLPTRIMMAAFGELMRSYDQRQNEFAADEFALDTVKSAGYDFKESTSWLVVPTYETDTPLDEPSWLDWVTAKINESYSYWPSHSDRLAALEARWAANC